jgi:hypothetical protein
MGSIELDSTTSMDIENVMKNEERLYIETLETIAPLAIKYLIKDDKGQSLFIARLELSMPAAMEKFEKELEDNLIKEVTYRIKQVNMPQYISYMRTIYDSDRIVTDKYKDDRRTGMVKISVVNEINTIKYKASKKTHMSNYFGMPEDRDRDEDFTVTPLWASPPSFNQAMTAYIDDNMKKAVHRPELSSWNKFKSMIYSKKPLPSEVSLEKPFLDPGVSGGTKRYRRKKSRRRQSIKKQRNINLRR